MKLLIPHLAIPCRDIEKSVQFYEVFLGCDIGRKYEDSAIINFFGTQLVLHRSDIMDVPVRIYPRHFGLVLDSEDSYAALQLIWDGHKGSSYVYEKLFTRNEGKFHEHRTFFILDPSDNLLEFKAYKNRDSIFGVENG